jgi:predicted nucleotidyltransferase
VLLHEPSAAQIRTATVHLKQELEELLQRPVDLVRLRERMNPALRATSMMVE